MKIAITGHTSGLGLSLYDHFSKNNEVIGMSRSNGYDLAKDQQSIIDVASKCDIFFNNAYYQVSQAQLISKLYNVIPVITSGSIASDLDTSKNSYFLNKKIIETTHKRLSNKTLIPILLLKMGLLENYKCKNSISYLEIIDSIEFWLLHPRITLIEFDNIFS